MSRVLAVGLDVGDARLVRSFAASGGMPCLADLIAGGAWAELETPAETLHVSAWPSLYTGTHPGEHGVYYPFQPVPGEQGAVRFRKDQYGRPTLWELASAAGVRCTVFDAPYTNPVPGARQVLEWGTWAHYVEPRTVPAALGPRMARACGAYPLGFEADRIGLAALDAGLLRARLLASAAAKGRAASWLARDEPWDFYLAVFGEPHPTAHYLWPRDLAPEAADERADAFAAAREVYRAVDSAIAQLVSAAGDVGHVLVVSGDGAGPNHAGWHLLPAVLERAGFLVPPGGAREGGARPRSLYGRLRARVPAGLRHWVSRRVSAGARERLARRAAAARIDWTRTRAYCLPTDLEGCVRVNLRGREPEGIVAPGELDALCAELSATLSALVNPATGQAAVREVVRVAEVFPGPRADRLPDLVVRWEDGAPLEALAGPGLGSVAGASPDPRPGTHRPPGFLVARGPGFAPGTRVEGASVLDFAPTVLHLLGLEPPAHMPGRILA